MLHPGRRWSKTLQSVGGLALCAVAGILAHASSETPSAASGGFRELAWSPDGRQIVASRWDRLWLLQPDGRRAAPLPGAEQQDTPFSDRDPAWSPDGKWIAFASDREGSFDLYIVPATGGRATRLTSLPGDERWPSWTRDAEVVFSYDSPEGQWDVCRVAVGRSPLAAPEPLSGLADAAVNELHARASPNGTLVAFASDRGNDDGDLDLWVADLSDEAATNRPPERTIGGRHLRITRERGDDQFPTWAPDGERIAYYSVREGLGSVWVADVGRRPSGGGEPARLRPASQPILLSRHGGIPAWSPAGDTIVISGLPDPDPFYNGNPARLHAEAPPAFAGGGAFRLWTVSAPVPVDAGTRGIAVDAPRTFTAAFDRAWGHLRDLYYSSGAGKSDWERLRGEYRGRAAAARDERALELVIDEMVARQPLIKPPVTSSRAVVAAGHPLAARAGALMLERGGNVVDAAIAVSFALGVVEPDASGIGGDGMALLVLEGMRAPVAIDYKDQTPSHATIDNARIFRDGRLVSDGPAAANIPGVVAGLDLLYRSYASRRIPWADLIAPAIEYAEQGFVLDEALPSSIATGKRHLEKYPEAARVFLPGGRLPRAGERFANPDYAATLRAIAADPQAFYRGEIARRIAADMEANGGIITREDLSQYRAIERAPLSGRYRGRVVYTAPPPVGSGASLLEALQILDRYRPRSGASYASDADFFHHAVESLKVRDRIRRIADPERWPVDLEDHLTPAHADLLFGRIDPRRASVLPDDRDDEERGGADRIGRGTTAFAVADARGNMIAVTQTLSTWGGTFYVSKGLGFLYNNHLRSNSTRTGQFGHLLPLMRSSTTSTPTLIFREGAPRVAVSAAGNAWIPASVFDIVLNVIDAGMPAQRAIEAPRFLVGRDPADPERTRARIQIEDRFPRAVLEELERRGHHFQKIGRKGEVRYGYAALAVIEEGGRVAAGAEPRRSHAAVAADGRVTTRGAR